MTAAAPPFLFYGFAAAGASRRSHGGLIEILIEKWLSLTALKGTGFSPYMQLARNGL
jgi:hypothetical protein